MSKADDAIIECVDEALSSSGRDKNSFYSMLETKYGITLPEIGEKFEKVHAALREAFGHNHYAIDRMIVSALHNGVLNESYSHLDEIEALAKVTEVFMAEAEMGLTASRATANLVSYANHLVKDAREMNRLLAKNKKKLLEAERMAAIGETAGMVGHDLRNPLQTISGEVYLMKNEVRKLSESEEKSSLQESIETIEQQVDYMDKIVSDLQTYVRPIHPHKQTVKLKPFVFSILNQIIIPKKVESKVEIDDSQEVYADPELLKRVLINLVTNAVQAMPTGGGLTLGARTSGKEKTIIVEDTGEGIPVNVRFKLFSPLFTTKSKGQGFGLAVCKRVVEAHGGTITFESQEGKGSKFIVNLPNV